MKYLVDINILIYLMNAKSVSLQEKFTKRPIEDFAISSITVAELIYGARKSQYVEKNLKAAIKIISPFFILDFTSQDAFIYGEIRAKLEKQGNIKGGNDLLIASQARRLDLIVLTANVKEYTRVDELAIENWAS